ncbi:hypothetical protein KFE98_00030 [bacterium SCSIO 12741]|nr:hypothetical protein KFE98_00030 [bacterium SCSIO 12741]
MNLQERIKALAAWGDAIEHLLKEYQQGEETRSWKDWNPIVRLAFHKNGWFSEDQVLFALERVREMLEEKALNEWVVNYSFADEQPSKWVGIVMAGNIPLVGFHDFLTVLVSGHKAAVKMSSDDSVLFPPLLELLAEVEPRMKDSFRPVTQLKDIDAVIATGSNNTARYFETYFSKYPHIIRKNRTSVAVLTGNESADELQALGKMCFDISDWAVETYPKFGFPKAMS